jgi:hypothetical protein
MQANTPSNDDIGDVHEHVQQIVQYLSQNPYATVEAEINGAACVVIAAVEDEQMENVQPLFIIPSAELILHINDTEDKKPIFGISKTHLN